MSTDKQSSKQHEMTSFAANNVFKNKLINEVNKNVSQEDELEPGGSVHFDWFVDKEFPEGRFGLMISKLGSEPGLVAETIYNLDATAVREIFNELGSSMQKIIIQDWEASLEENKRKQTELANALKKELSQSEKKEIENKLEDFKEGEKKIENKLKILR